MLFPNLNSTESVQYRDASTSKKATADQMEVDGLMKIVLPALELGKIARRQLVQQSTLTGWGNPGPQTKHLKGGAQQICFEEKAAQIIGRGSYY